MNILFLRLEFSYSGLVSVIYSLYHETTLVGSAKFSFSHETKEESPKVFKSIQTMIDAKNTVSLYASFGLHKKEYEEQFSKAFDISDLLESNGYFHGIPLKQIDSELTVKLKKLLKDEGEGETLNEVLCLFEDFIRQEIPKRKRKIFHGQENLVPIKIRKLREDAVIPKYETEGSVGFDLCPCEDTLVKAHSTFKVPTGLAFEPAVGYCLTVRTRSSVFFENKYNLLVATIDEDYRGQVMIILENKTDEDIMIPRGTRIAQGIVEKRYKAIFLEVEELNETKRGDRGVGSTGKI